MAACKPPRARVGLSGAGRGCLEGTCAFSPRPQPRPASGTRGREALGCLSCGRGAGDPEPTAIYTHTPGSQTQSLSPSLFFMFVFLIFDRIGRQWEAFRQQVKTFFFLAKCLKNLSNRHHSWAEGVPVLPISPPSHPHLPKLDEEVQ